MLRKRFVSYFLFVVTALLLTSSLHRCYQRIFNEKTTYFRRIYDFVLFMDIQNTQLFWISEIIIPDIRNVDIHSLTHSLLRLTS